MSIDTRFMAAAPNYYKTAPTEACENLRAIWNRHGLPGNVQLSLYGDPAVVVVNLNEVDELTEILRDKL